MAIEKTLSLLKPDTVSKNLSGKVIARLEDAGFRICAIKTVKMNKAQAEGFYKEHRDKPFFNGLITFMTSGPCITMVLEKENAVKNYRTLLGATDPKNADPGTLRYEFATDGRQNALHGSDSVENAQREIAYFFAENEIF